MAAAVFAGLVAIQLINPLNFSEVLRAIAWPGLLALVFLLFRNEISDFFEGLQQLCWGDKLVKRAIPPPSKLLPEEIPQVKNQDKPGNLFWLGHDIVTAMSYLYNQSEKPLLLRYVRQIRFHAARSGALSPELEQNLVRVYRLIETSPGNISKTDAQSAMRQLAALRDKLGAIAAKWQADFGTGWDTGRWPE